MPLKMENPVNEPKDFAGIHHAIQSTPVRNVMEQETSILPHLSLK